MRLGLIAMYVLFSVAEDGNHEIRVYFVSNLSVGHEQKFAKLGKRICVRSLTNIG